MAACVVGPNEIEIYKVRYARMCPIFAGAPNWQVPYGLFLRDAALALYLFCYAVYLAADEMCRWCPRASSVCMFFLSRVCPTGTARQNGEKRTHPFPIGIILATPSLFGALAHFIPAATATLHTGGERLTPVLPLGFPSVESRVLSQIHPQLVRYIQQQSVRRLPHNRRLSTLSSRAVHFAAGIHPKRIFGPSFCKNIVFR